MSNHNKLVVIMSTYKNDDFIFLIKSIESLYAQSFQNFDIFFGVDGYIPSETRVYLQNLKSSNNNFFPFYFEENRGLSPTLNSLIKKSIDKYDYFVRMDSDDISEHNRFEEQLSFLKKHKDIDIVGSNALEINNEGEVFKYTLYPEKHSSIVSRISVRNPMVHSAIMMRKNYFIKAGLYPESYHKNRKAALPIEDSLMWLKGITSGCKFYNIQKPLIKIRYDLQLFKRRGGFFNSYQEYKVNYQIIKTLKSKWYFHIYNILMFIIRIQPIFVRVILWRILR